MWKRCHIYVVPSCKWKNASQRKVLGFLSPFSSLLFIVFIKYATSTSWHHCSYQSWIMDNNSTHPRSVHPPWNQKRAPLRFCCLEDVFSLDKMVIFQVQNVSFRECKSWKNFHAFGWFVASAHHNWCSPSNYTSAMIFPESDSNSLLQLHASQIQHQKKKYSPTDTSYQDSAKIYAI